MDTLCFFEWEEVVLNLEYHSLSLPVLLPSPPHNIHTHTHTYPTTTERLRDTDLWFVLD